MVTNTWQRKNAERTYSQRKEEGAEALYFYPEIEFQTSEGERLIFNSKRKWLLFGFDIIQQKIVNGTLPASRHFYHEKS